jgi:hypothetical protein
MPANSTHADCDAALPGWVRGRDLLAGEDAVKAAGEKYLPRLEGQSDDDYAAYKARACFSNATRRAADAFVGMVFRKAPFVRLPEDGGQRSKARNGSTSPNPLPGAERVTRSTASGIGKAMQVFVNDADMLGTSLFGYAKNVVREVISVGRSGTSVDWEGDYEQFVFHGAFHSRPDVGWMPLSDVMVLNLDHYRLDADYKHGLHFTALPTAWVAGLDKQATLTIGSKAAWVFEDAKATAGFLEFRGDGLGSFERALERDERVMAILGSQILENQERVAETATAIMLRQAGENSVLANIATSVSESLTQVMRWVYWWNSTESIPELVTDGQVLLELNTAIQVTLPGSGRSQGLRGICTEALDAHGLSGTASGVHFLPT